MSVVEKDSLGFDEDSAERRLPEPAIMVVGGGKGGVGKTCIAVNLAVEIARRGWRVVLVDADLSCSNVEMVLGVRPESKLDSFFLAKGRKDLAPLLCNTAYPNLRIVPGTSGLLEVANPRFQKKQAFIRELKQLDADLVILDLDAGAHLNTLDFFLLADSHGIMVITPEKTSIDNAFKFLRAALFRRIERFYQTQDVALLLNRTETLPDFLAKLHAADFLSPEQRRVISGEIVAIARSFRPKVIVNRARNAYEAQIANNILRKFARTELLVETVPMGYLCFDQAVQEAVNSSEPFVVRFPDQTLSACIADVANRLGYF